MKKATTAKKTAVTKAAPVIAPEQLSIYEITVLLVVMPHDEDSRAALESQLNDYGAQDYDVTACVRTEEGHLLAVLKRVRPA